MVAARSSGRAATLFVVEDRRPTQAAGRGRPLTSKKPRRDRGGNLGEDGGAPDRYRWPLRGRPAGRGARSAGSPAGAGSAAEETAEPEHGGGSRGTGGGEREEREEEVAASAGPDRRETGWCSQRMVWKKALGRRSKLSPSCSGCSSLSSSEFAEPFMALVPSPSCPAGPFLFSVRCRPVPFREPSAAGKLLRGRRRRIQRGEARLGREEPLPPRRGRRSCRGVPERRGGSLALHALGRIG